MVRERGLLLALPPGSLSDEVLTAGTVAFAEDRVGPHTRLRIEAGLLAEDSTLMEHVAISDHEIKCLLVDFSIDVAVHLQPLLSEDLSNILVLTHQKWGWFPCPWRLLRRQ